jgi:hypothetical protein
VEGHGDDDGVMDGVWNWQDKVDFRLRKFPLPKSTVGESDITLTNNILRPRTIRYRRWWPPGAFTTSPLPPPPGPPSPPVQD